MQLQSLVMGLSPRGSKVPQGLWLGWGGLSTFQLGVSASLSLVCSGQVGQCLGGP